jgi:hypothetical protein
MSSSISATIESRGTVGWSVNQAEPASPYSSPVCDTNSSERRGRTELRANDSASSSSATVPLPSSSAPLRIESGRGARSARRLSRIARIRADSSGVAGRIGLSAPAGRTTRLKARSES